MPVSHYDEWKDGKPALIEEHSLAKHRILREYVEEYIRVLTSGSGSRGQERFTLTLVDGFAGGGLYRNLEGEEHLGSPLILIEAVAKAAAQINSQRRKEIFIDDEYIFVELRPNIARYLKSVLLERHPGVLDSERAVVREGSFDSWLDRIIARIKSRGGGGRAIFLLDQYGYTHATLPAIQRISSELKNAEVFLTITVDWASAYLSKDIADGDIYSHVCNVLRAPADASPRLSLDAGNHVESIPSPSRQRLVQKAFHDVIAAQSNFKYRTPFFIKSPESNRGYWFLHLANHRKANDVVKGLHWRIQNHFAHYGDGGLSMLGYDPKRDSQISRQPCLGAGFDFSDTARQFACKALMDDIPRRIRRFHDDGVTFGLFFEKVTNETPANTAILGEVINELVSCKVLVKRGANHEKRHSSTRLKLEDIIEPDRQTSFFFQGIPEADDPEDKDR